MVTVIILSTISLLLLAWFVFEIIIARRLFCCGYRVSATVTQTQQYSDGDRRVELEINGGNFAGRFQLGYMSGGFVRLRCGDTVKVIYHPSVNFVVPGTLGGIVARPIIAASLFLGSLIVLVAVGIPLSVK